MTQLTIKLQTKADLTGYIRAGVADQVREVAHRMNYEPREVQAMVWAGIRKQELKHPLPVSYKYLMIKNKAYYDTSLAILRP